MGAIQSNIKPSLIEYEPDILPYFQRLQLEYDFHLHLIPNQA